MKRKLNKHEIRLGMWLIEAKIASGNHEAVDHAVKMVDDVLNDSRISDKVREIFPNEITVLEIQRESREYLMMWQTYMRIVDTLELYLDGIEEDE